MTDLPDDKVCCHHTGFTKKCRSLVVSGKCNRWVQMQGVNRNTGDQFNKSDCIDNWGPFLAIEGNQMQRESGAAIESFRNEMVKVNQVTLALQSEELRRHLVGANNGQLALDRKPNRE